MLEARLNLVTRDGVTHKYRAITKSCTRSKSGISPTEIRTLELGLRSMVQDGSAPMVFAIFIGGQFAKFEVCPERELRRVQFGGSRVIVVT